MGIDKPEKLTNLIMILNIGSFTYDFTGGRVGGGCGLKFRHSMIDRFLATSADGHGGSFGDQHLGDRSSYSARSAGNQGHFTFERARGKLRRFAHAPMIQR